MSKKISPERQAAYHTGQLLFGCGILMFLSMFILIPVLGFALDPFASQGKIVSCFVVAVIGMILMAIGRMVMNVGKKGLAGSGILLDPEREREELEPFARMKGGMVKDGLEEAGLIDENGLKVGRGDSKSDAKSVIMIRCGQCRVLNDEDAKFCIQCGGAM